MVGGGEGIGKNLVRNSIWSFSCFFFFLFFSLFHVFSLFFFIVSCFFIKGSAVLSSLSATSLNSQCPDTLHVVCGIINYKQLFIPPQQENT